MNRQHKVIYCVLLILILSIANVQSVHGQGKLGRVRDAVRNSKPPKEENKSSRDDRGNRDRRNRNRGRSGGRRQRDCDSGLNLVIGSFFNPAPEVHVVHHSPPVAVVPQPVPVSAPPVLVAEPEPVYQSVVAPEVEHLDHDWGARFSLLGGTDFDDIVQGSLGMLLQAPGGLGLDTSVAMIRESGMDFRDHLYLGDVNLVYEPILRGDFRLRFGIGVNWLGDAYGSDAGFNMTSGFDLRLTERLISTGEIDFGTIGDTDITHAKISLGRLISPSTEWTVGYDHLDIGGVTIGSAFTGLRFRF